MLWWLDIVFAAISVTFAVVSTIMAAPWVRLRVAVKPAGGLTPELVVNNTGSRVAYPVSLDLYYTDGREEHWSHLYIEPGGFEKFLFLDSSNTNYLDLNQLAEAGIEAEVILSWPNLLGRKVRSVFNFSEIKSGWWSSEGHLHRDSP